MAFPCYHALLSLLCWYGPSESTGFGNYRWQSLALNIDFDTERMNSNVCTNVCGSASVKYSLISCSGSVLATQVLPLETLPGSFVAVLQLLSWVQASKSQVPHVASGVALQGNEAASPMFLLAGIYPWGLFFFLLSQGESVSKHGIKMVYPGTQNHVKEFQRQPHPCIAGIGPCYSPSTRGSNCR